MTLPQKQDRLHKTSSIYSVKGLRSLISGRKIDKEAVTNSPSYRDSSSTQQAFIGQHPTSHRSSSSRSIVLAWKSQLFIPKSEATQRSAIDKQSTCEIKRQSTSSAQKGSYRLPLPSSFLSARSIDPGLHNQPSMSFPLRMRNRTQPLATFSPRNSVLFPSIDDKVTCSRQPWWDNATLPREAITIHSSKAVQPKKTKDKGSNCNRYDLGFPVPIVSSSLSADEKDQASSSSSTLSIVEADQIIAAETRSSSDASFTTCHSSPHDVDASDSGSTPTLYSQRGFSKDACQSPLCDNHAFSPNVALRDEFPDQSCSIEDGGDQPEGLAIEGLHKNVQKYVEEEQDGRQERLQKWTSSERLRQDAVAVGPQPTLRNQLSLSDFLHELRGKEEVVDAAQFDKSFGSSSLDEEEDAAQICHAWRENIAFSSLGASLFNRSLQYTGDDSIEELQARAFPLRHEASRVSMQTIDLAPIQEASFDSLNTPSTDNSRDHFDLCAHLLRRAMEGKITVVKPRVYR